MPGTANWPFGDGGPVQAVRFTKPALSYLAGEVAAFTADQVAELVAAGVAEPVAEPGTEKAPETDHPAHAEQPDVKPQGEGGS